MMKALTSNHDADFWIEDDDKAFCLHLKAETEMNTELRNKLLSASTTGENIADEIEIGITDDSAEMIIYKKF